MVSLTDKIMDDGTYVEVPALLDKVTDLGKYIVKHTHCILESMEMPNKSHEEYPLSTGKAPFINLIEGAQRQLRIAQDLNYLSDRRVLSALAMADENDVQTKIIYEASGQNPQIDSIMMRLLKQCKNVDLYEVEKIKGEHFIVADKTNIGFEKIHPSKELSGVAWTKYKTLFLGKGYRLQFIKMESQATPKS